MKWKTAITLMVLIVRYAGQGDSYASKINS